jgi:autotransporter-associated beta strand protein
MCGGRSGIAVRFMAVGLVVSLGLDSKVNAAVKTWDGGGGDTNWNTAANWDGAGSGAVPVAGDSLVFAGATRLSNLNNLTAGTSFNGISFASGASAFTLGGTSSVALTSGVTNSSSSLQTITLPISIAATQTFNTGSAGLIQGATGGGTIGLISGAGGLIKTGSGTLTLNAANTYGGATTISEGRLLLSNAGTGTLPSSTAVSVASLATFDISDRSHTVGSISGAGSIVGNASNNQFTVGGNNASTLFSGNIASANNAVGAVVTLIKNGTGVLTLSGTNTKMASQVNNGTLVFQNLAAKPTNTATVAAGGTIGLGVGAVSGDYSAANVAALFNTTLTGFTLNASSGVAIDTTAGNFTQGTALTAARALTKLGANALTLSGANTYSGATTVSEGTLVVGNGTSGSLGGSSVVTVKSGAKLAGNVGTIGGAASIEGGGILAPGSATSGSIGLVTMSSTLSFVTGSVFDWDINTGAGTYDRVGLGSSKLSVTDGAIFNVASSTPFSDLYWSVPRSWTDIFGTNDISGFDVARFTYSAGGLVVGAPSSGSFSVSGNNLIWNVSSVPEPASTMGMLSLFAGSLMLRRNRKRA